MVCFETGYKISENIWSINMVEVNSIDDVRSAITVTRYAAERAHSKGYEDYYVSCHPLTVWQIKEKKAKGMPITTIEEF